MCSIGASLLIVNARLVNENQVVAADVYVSDGRIERIESDLSHLNAAQMIDADGKYLLPGAIDPQFSLRPRRQGLDSIQAELNAAVAGGITSTLLAPDHTFDAHNFTEELLSGQLPANLLVMAQASSDALKSGAVVNASEAHAIYVDMASINDALRIDDSATLEALLNSVEVPVVVNPVDLPTLLENEAAYRQIYGEELPWFIDLRIRSVDMSLKAIRTLLECMSKASDARLHLLHVSSADELSLIAEYPDLAERLSCNVRSDSLRFCDEDHRSKGALIKANPSLKTDIDRAALLQALLDDEIDTIGSGHIPWELQYKRGGYGEAKIGCPQAQLFLPSVLENYHDQILSLESIARKTSHAIADIFDIQDRGYLREGYFADMVLVDCDNSFIARDEDMYSKANWTVYNGNEFRSSIVATVVNGVPVWQQGFGLESRLPGRLL